MARVPGHELKLPDKGAAEKKRREEVELDYTLTSAELQKVQEENLKLRAENERMREALEFYARDGWTGPCAYPFIPWIMEDKGAKARAALAKPE